MNWNIPFHNARPLETDRRNDAEALSSLDRPATPESPGCGLPAFPIGRTACIDLGVPRTFEADVRDSLSWSE